MSELLLSGACFLAGVVVAARVLRARQDHAREAQSLPRAYAFSEIDLRSQGAELRRGRPELAPPSGEVSSEDPAPHLISLIAEAIREPLRQLRRTEGHSAEVVERLERIAWQARMLVSRPRPMQAKPTAPMTLLQEAAEEVPLLRDGAVSVSWSLINRQPIDLDPERTRGAFRELLAAGAEAATPGGRIGVKILPGGESGYPVRIEVEIGMRGSEMDSLSFLVARHILESQGARLEVDGNITRIQLRNATPMVDELAVA